MEEERRVINGEMFSAIVGLTLLIMSSRESRRRRQQPQQ
jgi:hypothetical protein